MRVKPIVRGLELGAMDVPDEDVAAVAAGNTVPSDTSIATHVATTINVRFRFRFRDVARATRRGRIVEDPRTPSSAIMQPNRRRQSPERRPEGDIQLMPPRIVAGLDN